MIPNPWDVGSARILAALGFEALATTSGGLAYSLGRRDGQGAVTRDEALRHAETIVEATPLPVSADLENGYGDDPETVAETIRAAAAAGPRGRLDRGRHHATRRAHLPARAGGRASAGRGRGLALAPVPLHGARGELPLRAPRP